MPNYTTKPKQVRFAYKNIFYSPPPTETPALSFSSTIPSSSGLITPPSMTRSIPYAPSHLPAKSTRMPSSRYAGPVHPHSYLDMFSVTWDLRDHQSTASRKHQSISRRELCKPATKPALPFLTIYSSRLPWIIQVYASNNSFVTVEDVLSSIYRSLRTNLTPSEFHKLQFPTLQRHAVRAYEERYRRQRSVRVYEKEKYGGMKRVDFLRGHTQFLGISNDGRQPKQWHLHLN
jgi:hypothetical protein